MEDTPKLTPIQIKILEAEKSKPQRKMGRPKKYNTEEEAKAMHTRDSTNYYQRLKTDAKLYQELLPMCRELEVEKEKAEAKAKELEAEVEKLKGRPVDPNELINKFNKSLEVQGDNTLKILQILEELKIDHDARLRKLESAVARLTVIKGAAKPRQELRSNSEGSTSPRR